MTKKGVKMSSTLNEFARWNKSDSAITPSAEYVRLGLVETGKLSDISKDLDKRFINKNLDKTENIKLNIDFGETVCAYLDQSGEAILHKPKKSLISKLICFRKGHVYGGEFCIRCGKSLRAFIGMRQGDFY
jgi:hypothetical protein